MKGHLEQASFAAEFHAKSGEKLREIAKKHGVSLVARVHGELVLEGDPVKVGEAVKEWVSWMGGNHG